MLIACFVLAMLGLAAFASGQEHFINGTNLGISIVTLLLLPVLQATQNRDGAALQAKLDELLIAIEPARNSLVGLEKRSEEEIEELRCSVPPEDLDEDAKADTAP